MTNDICLKGFWPPEAKLWLFGIFPKGPSIAQKRFNTSISAVFSRL